MSVDVLEFARSIRSTLEAHADQIERDRGLPKALATKLTRGGLFRLFTPQWLGGLEMKPHLAFQALEETAKGDMSAAWCAMISSTSALGAAWLSREAARDIFTHPDLIFAGVAAPMGKAMIKGDHYKASGHWPWGSGSNHADYFMGGCMVENTAGKLKHRMLIFKRAQIIITDNWHVMGLKGSSSNDVIVNDAIIPKTHSFSIGSDSPNSNSPLYQMPFFGLLASGVAVCALGNAFGVLEKVKALMIEKAPLGTRSTLAEKAYVQIGYAKRFAELTAAQNYFYQTLQNMWEVAVQGNMQKNYEARASMRLSAIYVTRTAAQVVARLHHLAGGSSVFLSSPIQRGLRDSQIATQHRMVSETNYQIIGQTLLGTADLKKLLTAQL